MESVGEVKLERCEALNGKPEYVKRPVRRCALCGALVYVQRTDRVIPICRDCWKEAFLDGEAEEARPPPSGEGVLPVRVHLNRYTRKGTKPVKTVENSPPGGASRLRGKRPPRGTDRPGRERNRRLQHQAGSGIDPGFQLAVEHIQPLAVPAEQLHLGDEPHGYTCSGDSPAPPDAVMAAYDTCSGDLGCLRQGGRDKAEGPDMELNPTPGPPRPEEIDR